MAWSTDAEDAKILPEKVQLTLPGDLRSWESPERRTMFGGNLFKYWYIKYLNCHQVFENTS